MDPASKAQALAVISDFHFLRPLWLLALALLPALWWQHQRRVAADSVWRRVVDAALLPHLLASSGAQAASWRRWLAPVLAFGYVMMVTALAGPVWQRLPQPLFNDRSALVILLDLSKSMDAQDVRPSRLARARFKIADLLARRGTGTTALVVYAADAYAVVPLTDDIATIGSQLPVLETSLMPAQGSHPERAIARALAFLDDAGLPGGDLLLVTDSFTTQDGTAAKALLAGRAVRVSFLAVGTADGAPIPTTGGAFVTDADGKTVMAKVDQRSMQAVAGATGGRMQGATANDDDVAALTAVLADQGRLAEARRADRSMQRWREEGPWLLLPLLPIAACAFRRGVLLLALVACLQWPRPAAAFSWADLWQRPDQQGQHALDSGDPKAAAERFRDPRWQGAARYRAGDFDAAADAWGGLSTSDDHYNRGNALVRSGRFGDAIAAYEQALKLDPKNADARHNRDLIRQLQQQSQQQRGAGEQKGSPPQDSANQSPPKGDPGGQKQEGQKGGDPASPQQNAGQDPAPPPDGQDQTEPAQSNRKLDELMARRPSEPPAAPEQRPEEGATKEEAAPGQPNPPDPHQREQNQADEQWLRRIPDDPGGLLRRKFYYQYSQSSQTPPSDTPW